MKVLYLNTIISHYNHPMLNKLVAKGCDLVMVVPQSDSNTVGAGVKRNDSTNQQYRRITTESKKAWYGKEYFPNLLTIIKQEKPDILLLGWPYMLQLYFQRSILRYLRKASIKLIFSDIPFQIPPFGDFDYFKRNPIYNESMVLQSKGIKFYLNALLLMIIRKYLYKRCDASINYCSAAYQIWPSYGVPKDRIFVRYNSGDTDAFFARKEDVLKAQPILPKCSQRILHIGRLVAWKRVDLLIDAYEKIYSKYPKSELTIVGSGPELEKLKSRAAASIAAKNIRFVGGVYDPFELGQYMHESSIYVLAGMGGLSINDAMCYELPVICSVCDGTEKDLIKDGKNGYFFKEGDASDLASKIEAVLSDEDKRKKMGAESLHIIEDKININTVADNYIKVFNNVLK